MVGDLMCQERKSVILSDVKPSVPIMRDKARQGSAMRMRVSGANKEIALSSITMLIFFVVLVKEKNLVLLNGKTTTIHTTLIQETSKAWLERSCS